MLQLGRSQVATLLGGVPMNVYRLGPATPPSGILDGPIVLTLQAKLERLTSRALLENQIFENIAEDAKCDNTNLVLGDLLVKTTDGAVYCYAQRLPTQPSIFIRCDFRAIIRRPVDTAAPTTPSADNSGAWTLGTVTAEVNEASSLPLTQIDGVYTFTPTAYNPVPVVIPVGVQPTTRARPGRPGETEPTATPIERFVGYIPPTGNAFIRDNDQIELQDGSGFVFVVEQVSSSGNIGLRGTTVLLSKQGA